MHRQALLLRRSVLASRQQLRTYAVDTGRLPPSSPPPPSPAAAGTIPTVVVSSTTPNAPAKPVFVSPAATASEADVRADAGPAPVIPPSPLNASSIPPPPPSGPPPPPKKYFRRFIIYTTLAGLTFYSASGYISTKSDSYRDFFTSTFPFGEEVADYADDNHWDRLGAHSIVDGAKNVSHNATDVFHRISGTAPDHRTLDETSKDVKDSISKKASALTKDAEKKLDQAKAKAGEFRASSEKKLDEAKAKAEDLKASSEKKLGQAKSDAKAEASSLKQSAKDAADKVTSKAQDAASTISSKTAELGSTIKEKAAAAVAAIPEVHFTDGVHELVDQAEKVLGTAKVEVKEKVDEAKEAAKGVLPKPSSATAGKQLYTGPPLPLGFEPPPGYYVAKPAASPVSKLSGPTSSKDTLTGQSPAKIEPNLPLLAPTVKDFPSSAEEPIISQLATTIDSLASSLSATSSAATTLSQSSPSSVLSKAKDDLSSLAARLEGLKAGEKEKLEKTVQQKTKEFEGVLKTKESEWRNQEGELKQGWKEEKEKLIEGWRNVLDSELEGQRTGIEQRLREEVIAQGIELQRRWLRSIKAQVETERGGRLAKLDNLTSSFKQLERITLDNSTQLDANVSLHTLWSALRAVQAKADKGGVAFDDELRVLKSAATAAVASGGDSETQEIIKTMLESIESSGAAVEGVKSFPSLSGWFSNSLAPKIQSVSLVPDEHEAGVLSHVASALLSKVLFTRKAGFVPGDDVGAVLARAEYYLGEKDLDGAAREVNQLNGWAGKLAGDWLREARKRLAVEQALEVVATEATLSSLLLV